MLRRAYTQLESVARRAKGQLCVVAGKVACLWPHAKALCRRVIGLVRGGISKLGAGCANAFRIWPATLVYLLLVLTFGAPGLLRGQALLALEGYVDHTDGLEVIWSRYLLNAVAALLLGTCLAQSSRQLAVVGGTTNGLWSSIVTWIHRMFPVACLAFGLLQVARSATTGGATYVALAGALVPVAIVYGLAAHRLCRIATINRAPDLWRHALGYTWHLALMLLLTWFFTFDREVSVAVARALGPVTLLIAFLLVFCGVTTGLVRAGRGIGLPIPLILVLLSFAFGRFDLNDNHPVRRAEERQTNRPLDVQDAFTQWLSGRPEQASYAEYPVFLVSAEGGGIRAAFFTAVTLARLVDRCPALANHLFAISAVSGGAVGAAVFTAALSAWPPDTLDDRCDLSAPVSSRYEDAVAQVLSDDHLSPLLARALFPDMLQRFLPFEVDAFDRQLGLEWSLETSFLRVFGADLLARPIYDFRPSVAKPVLPYLLLNATQVESGRRIVTTPLFLRTEEFGGVEDWHMLDWDQGPTLSSAATTSGRFPFLSPAGYHRAQGVKARYVDGGYIDNSGINTLMEVFKALYLLREQRYPAESAPRSFAMFAVHIGNAQVCDRATLRADKSRLSAEALRTCEGELARPSSSGVGELASPLQTLVNVRNAQVEYNLNRFHAEIDRGTDFRRFDFYARLQMFDRGIPIPLGWILSARISDELRSQLDANPGEGRCEANDIAGNYCELKSIAGVETWQD